LSVGDETIQNAKLELGEIFSHEHQLPTGSHISSEDLGKPDILLGFDFVRAHRIYIARGQSKLYFTYNGGPIFDVRAAEPAAAPPASKQH
jgi:hypothetical protein